MKKDFSFILIICLVKYKLIEGLIFFDICWNLSQIGKIRLISSYLYDINVEYVKLHKGLRKIIFINEYIM